MYLAYFCVLLSSFHYEYFLSFGFYDFFSDVEI